MSQPNTMDDEELLKDGVEPDHPPVPALVIEIVLMMVGLVISFALIYGAIKLATHREYDLKAGPAVNPRVAEMRAREAAVLSGYDQMDAAAGLYRIPVAKAIEKLVANPGLIKPLVAPAAPSEAPAAPESAPEGGRP